jgi:hypothetical protein
MTTWATFLSDIRAFLKDEGTTSKWSDRLIYVYTCDAVRDYSNWFPMTKRTEIAKSAGAYPLPSDLMTIYSVECPEGSYLKKRLVRPGFKFLTQNSPTLYWQVENGILLNSTTDDSIFLNYGAIHTYPSSSTDTTYVFSIPDHDMELLHLYVRANCLEQTRSRQANLDRFKRTGRRDDNPMNYEVSSLMDEYYAKIAERSKGGAIYLYGV